MGCEKVRGGGCAVRGAGAQSRSNHRRDSARRVKKNHKNAPIKSRTDVP